MQIEEQESFVVSQQPVKLQDNPAPSTVTSSSGSDKRKKDSAIEQPLFLRKAYAMINSCAPELGGWSAAGNSFVVHNPDDFAEQVVPTFYRHSNWASFVRQLNFYGFRKIKTEVYLNSEVPPWEFAHPCFLRGRPDLLSDIVRKIGPQGTCILRKSQRWMDGLIDCIFVCV